MKFKNITENAVLNAGGRLIEPGAEIYISDDYYNKHKDFIDKYVKDGKAVITTDETKKQKTPTSNKTGKKTSTRTNKTNSETKDTANKTTDDTKGTVNKPPMPQKNKTTDDTKDTVEQTTDDTKNKTTK